MTSVCSFTTEPEAGSFSAVVTGMFTSYPKPFNSMIACNGVAEVSVPWIEVIIRSQSSEWRVAGSESKVSSSEQMGITLFAREGPLAHQTVWKLCLEL